MKPQRVKQPRVLTNRNLTPESAKIHNIICVQLDRWLLERKGNRCGER